MSHYIRNISMALSILSMISVAGCERSSQPSTSVISDTAGQHQKVITVTDSLGRKVTIPKYVSRAAITNAYNAELINAIGALDSVCGVDYYIFQDQSGFKNKFNKDMVIGTAQGGLDFEHIAKMHPDVLILCENDGWENAEKKLKPFGIPVIVCNAYYTDLFQQNMDLLGKIFHREKQAQEVSDYFMSKLDYVRKQLNDVPKKSVYFEYRNPGNTTIPGDYFYNMIEYAHGNNIFSDAKATKIQLEDVVKKNPQYIVKVSEPGVYSSYIPPTIDDMKRIYHSIEDRPGWDSIRAVQDNHILLLSHYVHGGASKLVGTFYIAKFMYPEELPDLNPEDIFKTWVTRYQGLDYKQGHTYPAFELGNNHGTE